MRVAKGQELRLCSGGPKQKCFRYFVKQQMDSAIDAWLLENFKGYGQDYYYSYGELWFTHSKQEVLFTLRWR